MRDSGELPLDARVQFNILPGTYKMKDDSTLHIDSYQIPYLIFNGVGPEKSHITGLADEPITGWTNLGGDVWEAPWPNDFGYYLPPDSFVCGEDGYEGWIGCLLNTWIPDPAAGQWRDAHTILRREMIYVGDQRLAQVGDPESLEHKVNSFQVPYDQPGSILIRSQADPDLNPVTYSGLPVPDFRAARARPRAAQSGILARQSVHQIRHG